MGKYLEALKLLYGEDENIPETLNSGTDKTIKSPFVGSDGSTSGHIRNIQAEIDLDTVPFTDHEIAEHMISKEVHRDDQSFVRQQLIGTYGAARLKRVDEYLEQFTIGSDSVDQPHKKSNAGRRRANTWIRENAGERKKL
jgi:hypothetical protein